MPIIRWFQTLTPQQRAWFPYLILTMSVFAAYANVYQNAFVWDDLTLIVNNDSLRHWSGLPSLLGKTTLGPYYRPIQALLYFFVYQIFGLSQAAFHSANVLLQAANACLAYRLGCRLGFYKRASFAAVLLWGIHPLWIEAVAIAGGTADLLVGFFCMMGLLTLLPDFAPRKFWLAILFFILALGSKESAVVFPALVTFTLFLVSKERLRSTTYLKTWPLWLLAAAYLTGWLMCPALNNFAAYVHRDALYSDIYVHNFINRVLTSLATLPVYLGLVVWPADLHMDWIFPIFTTVWDWQVIAGAMIVVVVVLQIVRGDGRKRGLPLTWGLLWFAAALSPYTGILKPVDGQLFEHWIYLPTIGLFLGVSQTAVVWMNTLHSKKVPIVVAGLVALVALGLGTKTYLQNEILYNARSLFENVLKYNPDLPWAHYKLGLFYLEQGEFDKAIELFQYVINNPPRSPNTTWAAEVHLLLAMAWLHVPIDEKNVILLDDVVRALPTARHIPEAIGELGKVLQNNPDYYWAHAALAYIYHYQGNNQMADFHTKQANAIFQEQENIMERTR